MRIENSVTRGNFSASHTFVTEFAIRTSQLLKTLIFLHIRREAPLDWPVRGTVILYQGKQDDYRAVIWRHIDHFHIKFWRQIWTSFSTKRASPIRAEPSTVWLNLICKHTMDKIVHYLSFKLTFESKICKQKYFRLLDRLCFFFFFFFFVPTLQFYGLPEKNKNIFIPTDPNIF